MDKKPTQSTLKQILGMSKKWKILIGVIGTGIILYLIIFTVFPKANNTPPYKPPKTNTSIQNQSSSLPSKTIYKTPDDVFKEFQNILEKHQFYRLKDISTNEFASRDVFKEIVNSAYNGYDYLHAELIPENSSTNSYMRTGSDIPYYMYYISILNKDTLIHKKVIMIDKVGDSYAVVNIADLFDSKKSESPSQTISNPNETSQPKQNTSYLYNGTGNVAVALSEGAMDKAVDAAIKKDYQKFDSLILSGELLPVKDDTKIQILSAGMARTKIRIEDGAYSGQIGYVQTEFIKVK